MWCGLPPGLLVGSQSLDGAQMQRSSGASARSPTEIDEKQEICNPTPDGEGGILSKIRDVLKESRGAGTRSCAGSRPARRQAGGHRNLRRMRDSICADVRMLVDHVMRRD